MALRLPSSLDPALVARGRALVSAASGRMLVLEGDDPLEMPVASDVDARFDTILSFGRTPLVADLDQFVERLIALLAPEGYIFLIEPTLPSPRHRRVGIRRRTRQSVAGFPAHRDVPAVLRSHGLVVTDLHRLRVPDASGAVRWFVEARARRPLS